MDEKTMEMMKGIYENLTDEQKERAKACKTNDELMELAGEFGIELPGEFLAAVAGGEECALCSGASCNPKGPCPFAFGYATCSIVRDGSGSC